MGRTKRAVKKEEDRWGVRMDELDEESVRKRKYDLEVDKSFYQTQLAKAARANCIEDCEKFQAQLDKIEKDLQIVEFQLQGLEAKKKKYQKINQKNELIGKRDDIFSIMQKRNNLALKIEAGLNQLVEDFRTFYELREDILKKSSGFALREKITQTLDRWKISKVHLATIFEASPHLEQIAEVLRDIRLSSFRNINFPQTVKQAQEQVWELLEKKIKEMNIHG